jgi:competence protein ComEC
MFAWAPFPFVRLVLFFCAGILGGIYLPDVLAIDLAKILFAVLGVFFILVAYGRSKGVLKSINPGIIGLVCVMLAGYVQVYHATDYRNPDHFLHDTDTIRYYKVVVTGQAQEKKNSWKVEAHVLAVQHGKMWSERSGNVLLYFSKNDFAIPFQYGDALLLKGSPRELPEPANPGEFDYKKFLTYKKIYHQHFLRGDDVIQIGHRSPSMLIDYSIRARVWADETLKRNINGAREQATASALVLGVTDGLDNDLLGAYAATGSLHVLSVSGLHVGIIYWLILLVLKPLNKSSSGKWTLAIFSILVLWAYAFVTGLSPSVLRAVTMFSCVAIARPWGKRSNIFNTLAVSAFCLLLYEPYLIMAVGFQLSYLAVIGIVYLQPFLLRFWEPQNWLWDNIWQITCVSVAAQIATFTLGLLYFHQFPVYFLLSNLFVIPGSFLVLVLGILLIGVSLIGPVAELVGFLLEWSIRILNYGVLEMEALPFGLIDRVYITTFQCWLLILVILFLTLLLKFRKSSTMIPITLCVILIGLTRWIHFRREVDSQLFTVYNIAGHSALDVFDRGHAYFFSDSTLIKDEERIRFHIQPNRLLHGVNEVYSGDRLAFAKDFPGCRILTKEDVTILQITDGEFFFPGNSNPDYIVVGNNAIKDMRMLSSLKCKELILDSSNSFYFASRMLKEAKRISLKTHSVLHQGAFVTKL